MRILGLTSDAVLLGGVLTTVAHRELVVHVPKRIVLECVKSLELAKRGVGARDEESKNVTMLIDKRERKI